MKISSIYITGEDRKILYPIIRKLLYGARSKITDSALHKYLRNRKVDFDDENEKIIIIEAEGDEEYI